MKSTKFIEAEKQHFEIVARIEAQEGQPIAEALRRLYMEEGLSYNELKAHLAVSVSRVMRLLKECGIAARPKSEAVKMGLAKTACQRKAASVVTARIEQLEREPVAAVLRRLYEQEGLTYRQLMERWRVNARQLKQLMSESGVEPHGRSEAVARQWMNNAERRQAASLLLGEISRRQVAEGRHSCLGRTKDKCRPGRFDALIAAGQNPEVRKRHSINQRQRFALNPSAHPLAKVVPTVNENLMLSFCRSVGLDVVHNQPIVGYWIDVYLPGLKVGIECVSVGRHPSWERHQALVAQGVHMLYVMNTAIERAELTYFAEYIAALPTLQNLLNFRLRDAVVWGSRRASFFPDTPEGMIVEVVSLKGSGCLRFSMASRRGIVA
jgi:hypothetical protein